MPRRLLLAVVGLGLCGGLVAQPGSPLKPAATFKGHADPVYAVALSPDGQLAATGSFDKSIKLWDLATGKEVRTLAGPNGHQSLVLSVAFSPAGDLLASGGADNAARLWDVPSAKPLRELAAGAGVTRVAASPDGKTLAAGTADGRVKAWSAADGKPLFELTGHAGAVTGVAFANNGQALVTTGADRTLRYWNAATGQPVAAHGVGPVAAGGLAVHPGNAAVYTAGSDGVLRVWPVQPAGAKKLPDHAAAVTAVAVSADGNFTLTGGADKAVRWVNLGTGQPTLQLAGATAQVTAVAVMPNATTFAAGTADGKVFHWGNDGKPRGEVVAHAGPVRGVSFHPSQPQFVTAGEDGALKVWQLPAAAPKALAHPDKVLAAALLPDGKRLVTGSADKLVRVWNNGAVERQFAGHEAAVTAVAAVGDVVCSGDAAGTVRVWGLTSGQPAGMIAGHEKPVVRVAASADGKFLASADAAGAVKVWKLPFAAPKQLAHPDVVQTVIPTADGKRLVTVGNDKQVRVWNLASGQPERASPVPPATAVAASADGGTVAATAADKSIAVWKDGKELKKLTAPVAAGAVAVSPDGKSVAAGLPDGTVRVFALPDGKEAAKLDAHKGAITFVGYTADGAQIVTAGADKAVRAWIAATGKPEATKTLDQPITAVVLGRPRPDKTLPMAVATADRGVRVGTIAALPDKPTVVAGADVRGIGFDPGGKSVAVATADGFVRVYAADGKLLYSLRPDGGAAACAVLPDGGGVVTAGADKTVKVWADPLAATAQVQGAVRFLEAVPGPPAFQVADETGRLQSIDGTTGKITSLADPLPAAAFARLPTGAKSAAVVAGPKPALVVRGPDHKPLREVPLPAPAEAVALSPSGTRAAVALAGAKGRSVVVFDADTGRELQTVAAPAAAVHALGFLPDNRTLYVAAEDKAVSFADLAVTAAVPAHAGGAKAALYLPNGQIVTAGADKAVKFWDAALAKEVRALPLPGPARALAASRDGAVIAAAAGRAVKLWQAGDGKELPFPALPFEPTALAFSPDRTKLVLGSAEKAAWVYDVATGEPVQFFPHGGAVTAVAGHPAQPAFVVAGDDKAAAVHTLAVTRVVKDPELVRGPLAVFPTATHLVTGGGGAAATGWNLGNMSKERAFEAAAPVTAVAVSKNAQLLAVAGGPEPTVHLLTAADGKTVGTFRVPAKVTDLAFHPNGQMLAGVLADKTLTAWNVVIAPGQPVPPEFGNPVQAFAPPGAATSLAFVGDAGQPLVVGCEDGTARVWRVASDQPAKSLPHPNLVDAVAFDKTGTLLATACHDGLVRVFDVAKGTQAKQIAAHTMPTPSPVYAVIWTPDAKQLVSASYDKSIKVWDAASGNLVREIKPGADAPPAPGHRDQVFALAVSKDGKLLASGSSDRTVKLWDLAAGTLVREFPNPTLKAGPAGQSHPSHPGFVHALRFTPDGKALVSVGTAPRNQGYVAVWSVADGKLIAGGEQPVGPVYAVELTADGAAALLGCGPKLRGQAEAEAVLVRVPGR